MISNCNTLTHPLLHNGTQQRDRLLLSLIPEQLKLDDRSIEELIAFAGTLSTHVRYWDENNQAAGDWLPFWESDNTSLFAILAATDLDSPRTDYRTKEIEYYELKKKEDQGTNPPNGPTSKSIIDELVTNPDFGIYGLASIILKICEKIPAGHPLKADIISIITTLQGPLKELIKFHKAIDAQAIKKYSGFIGATDCAASWGLKDNAAFECIDFVLPYEYPEELWKLFLTFYKALSLVIEKVRKAFQSSLRSRKNHQPQITLFITFLHLFKHLQDDLNSLTGKHLMYYYHDILQLEKRRLIPDKVHIVYEIATNIVRHRITKGTELKGGTDELGVSMSYAMEDELVIANTKLAERKNLYMTEVTESKGEKKVYAIALQAADKRDGLEEEWPAGFKAWHPLSGAAVYERFNYKLRKMIALRDKFDGKQLPDAFREEFQKNNAILQRLNAMSGFSISSMEFWLNKGFSRIISIDFTFAQTETTNLLDEYAVELSTETGLIQLKPYFEELDNNNLETDTGVPESTRILQDQLFGESGLVFRKRALLNNESVDNDTLNRIVKIKDKQWYLIFLSSSFPSILPLDGEKPPFLRFRALNNFSSPLSDINEITIFSYSDGTLDPLKNSKPGILFRERNSVEESADEFVITSIDQQDILVRYPELFVKEPHFINVSIPTIYTGTNFAIMNNDLWVTIPSTNLPPIPGFTETSDLPGPPDQFNFNALAHNADGWVKIEFSLPNTTPVPSVPIVLASTDIQITYRSDLLVIPVSGTRVASRHYISYFTSLGDWIADLSGNRGLRPAPSIEQPLLKQNLDDTLFDNKNNQPLAIANGNLFLGFENISPDQTLSLLIKTADGTGNPDHYAPEVTWSYLKDNRWVGIPPHFILRDSTLGMKQTGILLFQVPGDINNGNTWIKGKDDRTDLYWLRASATEVPDDLVLVDALPMLKDIHVNAAEVEFIDNNNTETHLDNGIPAGTISALKFRDVGVQTVLQPYPSFDGRRSEKADRNGYLQRISERLRHKDRAVTIWDYERIILQEFPKAIVVKCVSHTRRIYTARPGHVTVAAIPFPNTMTGNLIYYPIFSAGVLETMKQFLAKRNSYFVGGYGDPEFCCCEENCTCEHGIQRIDVINARFEPVRLKVCVRFYQGKDIPFYTKQLNEDLKTFLAPWANSNKPLVFGMPISMTRLLRFLENLDYVDVIMGLQLKHFSSREMAEELEDNIPWSSPEQVTPFTTISVLTTYLDKLNEDNPNVIDHVINVIDTYDKCKCQSCSDALAQLPDPNAGTIDMLRNTAHQLWVQHSSVATVIREFKRVLDEQVDNNVLKGNKVSNPEEGEEGRDAYRIEKIKISGKIRQLAIKVAFDANKPFTVFHVNNPNN